MESDFTNLITQWVRQSEPDLDSRLESQAEALAELKCTEPTLGKWVDEYDVQYLMAAFNLNDVDFAEAFPKLAHFTEQHRNRIIETFERHFEHCPHCQRKRSYDLEFNLRIELACRENRDELLEQLRTERAAVSADGVQDKDAHVLTAHS